MDDVADADDAADAQDGSSCHKNKAAAMKVRDREDDETSAGVFSKDVMRDGVPDASLLNHGISRFLTSNHAVSCFFSTRPSQTKVESSNMNERGSNSAFASSAEDDRRGSYINVSSPSRTECVRRKSMHEV